MGLAFSTVYCIYKYPLMLFMKPHINVQCKKQPVNIAFGSRIFNCITVLLAYKTTIYKNLFLCACVCILPWPVFFTSGFWPRYVSLRCANPYFRLINTAQCTPAPIHWSYTPFFSYWNIEKIREKSQLGKKSPEVLQLLLVQKCNCRWHLEI
jgi:hypothetical protein